LDSWDLTGAGTFVFEGFINPCAFSSHFLKSLEIGAEPPVRRRTVLEAFEIGFQLERGFRRKAVDHPGPMPGAFDHALLAEIGEMLGNLGLRKSKDLLKMADAQRSMGKQMDDPQPCSVAETLVNLDQFHGRNMFCRIYDCQYIYIHSIQYISAFCHGIWMPETDGTEHLAF
jgi:hypothetical protein